MITWIQVIGIFFALDMIFLTYLYYKRDIFRSHDATLWSLIWIGFMVVVAFPEWLEVIANPLQVIRVMDLLTIGALFLVFGLTFTIFIKLKYSERRIEKIVRALALKEAEDEG
ncbi:MAG: DUF2304 domain-containing protein [Candidatus Hydrothermarchaeales archaeon]